MTTISRGPDAGTALGPFVRAIRSHVIVFALVTLAALGAAAALLATRSPTYEATAELLVTPLQQDDRTFLGIPLLRDSGDPTRTVQTAAALIASPVVARRTAQALGGGLTQETVEAAVTVEPLGESNIVGVTARSASAPESARVANRYAQESLALRTEQFAGQLERAIQALRDVARADGGVLSAEDRTRLTELRAVRDRGDPSLSLSQPARAPSSPNDAPAWLVMALALLAGLTLAAIVTVLMERLDRRVRDADELVLLAPIPILARVPTVRRGERGSSVLDVPPGVRESFRTLQLQIDQRRAQRGGHGNTIVVASASSGDGKTTTAICLALALIAAGHKVVLVDCDLRRPDLGPRLGLGPAAGLATLNSEAATLKGLMQRVDELPSLRVLTVADGTGAMTSVPELTRLLNEVLAVSDTIADYIVIDTAPLGVVGDALSVTPHADELLLVGRAHNTDRRALEDAVALLDRGGTPPTGWIVIGDDSARRDSYYYAGGGGGPAQPRRRRGRGG